MEQRFEALLGTLKARQLRTAQKFSGFWVGREFRFFFLPLVRREWKNGSNGNVMVLIIVPIPPFRRDADVHVLSTAACSDGTCAEAAKKKGFLTFEGELLLQAHGFSCRCCRNWKKPPELHRPLSEWPGQGQHDNTVIELSGKACTQCNCPLPPQPLRLPLRDWPGQGGGRCRAAAGLHLAQRLQVPSGADVVLVEVI